MTPRALLVSSSLLLSACASAPPSTRPPREAAAGERRLALPGPAGSLWVSDGGAGEPAVVFVHGLGSELEVWRPELDRLRASRRVVAYDQRGHGASGRAPASGYTIEALAEDLEVVRRALGIERMILVGHSLAGAVLTTYAGAHPGRVAGLVYVDAIGDFGAVPPEALQPLVDRETAPAFGAREVRAAFEEMLGPHARPGTRALLLASVERMDPSAYGALRRSLFGFRDARRRLAAFQGPTLAVEAAENPYPGVMASRVLAVPRTAVAGVSHWLQLDDPAALARALDGFLASLPPRG